jgi:predicted nucleotidyltransferase component of viral defense system
LISKQDILERAAEWRLRPDVVEKDYVLGWLLAGIGSHLETAETWVFKGGTCLKKCYFETYRFSEDLDFSLLPEALYAIVDIQRQLTEVARWVQEQSGIELPEASLVVEQKQNKQGQPTFRARISYRGPLAMPTPPRVLIDITQHEIVAAEPEERAIFHPYPDDIPDGTSVLSYCIEELFAEKTRALHERTRPRDLYDVVQLVENFGDAVDFESARELFRTKCTSKGIPVPTSAVLLGQVRDSAELDADWRTMLAHQLPALPPLEGIRIRISEVLTWVDEPIVETIEPAPVEVAPVAPPPIVPTASLPRVTARAGEQIVAPQGGVFWGTAGPLELVRFAGANRLMISFSYNGVSRHAEPYSLRRAGTGNLLLYAWEEAAGHVKAFKVDQISSLAVSEETFSPRYSIELNAITYAPVRPPRQPSVRRRRSSSGPTYVFECTHCHKTFRHSRNDSTLRAHKLPGGYGRCSGRRGYLVRTE